MIEVFLLGLTVGVVLGALVVAGAIAATRSQEKSAP